MYPRFEVLHRNQYGRTGIIHTLHGTVHTPAFVFCATKGTVRGICPWQLKALGVEIILSNTYHNLVSPGLDGIKTIGSLQALSGWNGPTLTDSGGFQVFCMGHGSVADEIKGKRGSSQSTVLKIDETGVLFRSYRDGSLIHLTPERSIEMQIALGADLVVNFDECTPFHIDKHATHKALHRTNRWQDRGLQAFTHHKRPYQGLYGVMQGGVYPDLRTHSIQYLNDRPYFGYAIGGSLGRSLDDMHAVLRIFNSHALSDRPTHLLGMGGNIREIFEAVQYGIDTFDCVHPTRIARHGIAITRPTNINLRKSSCAAITAPIDSNCTCMTCKTYSQCALHALLKTGDMTALILITVHNVHTMTHIMSEIRNSLTDGTFIKIKDYWCKSSLT